MQTISIGTIRYAEEFREKLAAQFATLTEEGIRVEISEDDSGDYTFFHFDIVSKTIGSEQFSGISRYTFIYYIANLLSEVVVDKLESSLIKKIIDNNYEYFLNEEKETILQSACRSLSLGMIGRDKQILHQLERKKSIFQHLLEYLEENNRLVIEGFLRFRLQEYYSQLEEAVNQGVEAYIMEKEYKEFVRLLKYFVEMQEPRIEEVHVVWLANKNFQIVDAQGRVMNNDLLEDFALDILDEGIDQGDLLVSTLITISPLRIVIHSREQKEVIETIKSIFSTRVTVCLGCHLCSILDTRSEEERRELVTSTVSFSASKEQSENRV